MPGTRKPDKRKRKRFRPVTGGRPHMTPTYLLWRRELIAAKIDDMREELEKAGVYHPKKEEPPC